MLLPDWLVVEYLEHRGLAESGLSLDCRCLEDTRLTTGDKLPATPDTSNWSKRNATSARLVLADGPETILKRDDVANSDVVAHGFAPFGSENQRPSSATTEGCRKLIIGHWVFWPGRAMLDLLSNFLVAP